jgi:hypothetical protein
MLAEAAALQTLRALGWPRDEQHFVLSSAGKFRLRGPDNAGTSERLRGFEREFAEWLLRETRGARVCQGTQRPAAAVGRVGGSDQHHQ